MNSKSDNSEFMIYGNADEVMEELFQSFISSHQFRLKTSMRDSDFIFDCVYLLY